MDPSDHDDDKSEIKKSSIKIKPANIIPMLRRKSVPRLKRILPRLRRQLPVLQGVSTSISIINK